MAKLVTCDEQGRSDFVIADFGGAAAIMRSMKQFGFVLSRSLARFSNGPCRLSNGVPARRILFGILTLVITVTSTAAKLGDNEGQINAAYGKLIQKLPRTEGSVSNLYEKGDYIYMVVFRGGVSVFEMYARANQADLSSKEIATFLKANAAGAEWVAVDNKGASREWKRSDHKAKASYFRLGGRPTLTVMEATPKR